MDKFNRKKSDSNAVITTNNKKKKKLNKVNTPRRWKSPRIKRKCRVEVKTSLRAKPRRRKLKPSKPAANLFDQDFEVEEINGAFPSRTGIKFLIKFKGMTELQEVPAAVANIEIPQVIIKFYEGIREWASDEEEAAN